MTKQDSSRLSNSSKRQSIKKEIDELHLQLSSSGVVKCDSKILKTVSKVLDKKEATEVLTEINKNLQVEYKDKR